MLDKTRVQAATLELVGEQLGERRLGARRVGRLDAHAAAQQVDSEAPVRGHAGGAPATGRRVESRSISVGASTVCCGGAA